MMLLSVNYALTEKFRIVVRINANTLSCPVQPVITHSPHSTQRMICGVPWARVARRTVKPNIAFATGIPNEIFFACAHISRNVLKMLSHFFFINTFMCMHDVVDSLTDPVSVASISAMIHDYCVSNKLNRVHFDVSHYLFFFF